MSLQSRLRRLTERLGAAPAASTELSPEERMKRLEWWISGQTYNRGVLDTDPEFRPAWSHYHDLWQADRQGRFPLDAVWLTRKQPDFEAARCRVVGIMVRVLRLQPSPVCVIAEILERTILAGHPS
jgi:hypothetical protein